MSKSKFKVLIAEDDRDARKLLRDFLENLSFEIYETSNGTDALDIIEKEEISMVLLDWVMPGIEGIEVCRKIRDLDINRYIYIIMVTGKSEKKDIMAGLHVRADDYVVKPFRFQELKVRIMSCERILKLEKRLREAHEKLYELSVYDSLTGVFNRATILEKFSQELERGQRIGHEVSIIFADIDDFKSINDKFGHLIGDEVLKEIADILSENCRNYDFVGRYGGEEFVIIVPGLKSDCACSVAERMRKAVCENPVHVANMEIPVTLSLGVASSKESGDTKEIIGLADKALYEAKKSGKNSTVKSKT